MNRTGRVGGLIGVAILVLLWWLASAVLYPETHAIPTPWAVLGKYFQGFYWGEIRSKFGPTVVEALWGYLWGNLAALVLALLVLEFAPLREIVTQFAVITYCLPPVALAPIIAVIAGHEHPAAAPIIIAALAPFFTTVVGAVVGLQSASRTTLDVVTAYGGGWFSKVTKVRVIAALPNVFAALQLAAPAAFLGAVLAEVVGGGGDLSVGRKLLAAERAGNYPELWWTALTCGAVAGIGYGVVGLLAKLVTAWAHGLGLHWRTVLSVSPATTAAQS